jgi:hypothetical protein
MASTGDTKAGLEMKILNTLLGRRRKLPGGWRGVGTIVTAAALLVTLKGDDLAAMLDKMRRTPEGRADEAALMAALADAHSYAQHVVELLLAAEEILAKAGKLADAAAPSKPKLKIIK